MLTGGGAELKGIADYAKQALQLSARVGKPSGFTGMSEQVNNPSFATATGLMLSDLLDESSDLSQKKDTEKSSAASLGKTFTDKITGVFGKFRS